MVKRVGTIGTKTRNQYKKRVRERGKLNVNRFLQEFEIGDRVYLAVEPAYHKGRYYRRYHSKVGVLKSRAGSCYNVEIRDRAVRKTLVVHPVHLKKIEAR